MVRVAEKICARCERPIQEANKRCRTHRPIVSVRYFHAGYGCDTGCCGHVFELTDDAGDTIERDFDFMHDKDALDEKARELAHKYRARVGECEFRDNC